MGLTKDGDLTIIGLDSSGPDVDKGHIGSPQQLWMKNELDKSLNNSNFSIVAMHHHVIPVPKTGGKEMFYLMLEIYYKV